MRILILIVLLSWALPGAAKAPAPLKKDLKDSLAYAIGMDVGKSLKDISVDVPTFMQGLQDIIQERPTLMTVEQAAEVRKSSFLRINEQQGEKAKKAGQDFLAKNKENKSVVVTASGLQYIAVREGAGPKPKVTDKAVVNYKGTLVDGTEFDNSYARGQPLTINVGNVIPGWSEALLLMSKGSYYKLFIPSDLAYGDRRMGAKIPPNSTLLFDVELLDILADSGATTAPDPLKGVRRQQK
jgi:FKBP-type peptidyl-prolyl cis-trans isomerase